MEEPEDVDLKAQQEQLTGARILEIDDFKTFMSDARGRRVMWRVLSMTGIFRNAFVMGDAHATAFRCGEQNIGHQLLGEITTLCPERYHEMVGESQ